MRKVTIKEKGMAARNAGRLDSSLFYDEKGMISLWLKGNIHEKEQTEDATNARENCEIKVASRWKIQGSKLNKIGKL